MKIFIAEPAEINQKASEILSANGHMPVTHIKETDDIECVIVRTLTKCDKQYLDRFSNLKYLLRVGVGLDNIDIEECKRREIQVINAPGSNANAVAEYVVGLMIAASRNLILQSDRLKKGKWRNMQLLGRELSGKTIGIIGCGAIGKLVAKKIKSFDIDEILGYDPYLDSATLETFSIKKTDLNTLYSRSDYITLHLPLLKDTKKMISEAQFKAMKKETVLINTSRGEILDEDALINALLKNTIRAAAIDVFENEPNVNKKLLEIPNLIATPHIAALTEEADEEMAVQPVKRLLSILTSPPQKEPV